MLMEELGGDTLQQVYAQEERSRKRTKDIQIDHDVDFSELLLSPPVLKGLSEAGYPLFMKRGLENVYT